MLFHPFENRPRHSKWDETRSLSTLYELPKKRLMFSDQYNVARIVIDCEEFLKLCGEQRTHDKECTVYGDIDDAQETLILDTIRNKISETDEIRVDEMLKDLNVTETPYTMDKVVHHCINAGKVSLYDIKNNKYVQEYIIHDSGYLGGPLFGGGSIEYRLPDDKDGRLFFGYRWAT